jgi:hypothetical protein
MRTAERSQNHTRSQITATSIYLVLVVIPIMGAMLVAWQLGSRLFFGAGQADAPAVTTKFGPALPSRIGAPERGQVASPSFPTQSAPTQSATAQSAPAQTAPSHNILAQTAPTGTGSLPVSRAEPAPLDPPIATPWSNELAPDPAATAAVPRPAAEPDPVGAAPPARVASVNPPATSNPSAGANQEAAGTGKGLVDLNSASIEELNRLGAGRIGRAIVRGRPYASTEDLVRKRVLNRSRFARIKEQVRAGNNVAAQ